MIQGIHHVTALASDAQATIDFYAGLLGLSLVKRTVNYEEPSLHHLYFGDPTGRPGSLLTFFVLPGGRKGRIGRGQVAQTILAVPAGALDFWRQLLTEAGVEVREGNSGMLAFADPDGLSLALLASGDPGEEGAGPIPAEFAIRGLHGVVLATANADSARVFFTESLGFSGSEESGFLRASASPLQDLVLLHPGGARVPVGLAGSGTVHHVAFRVPNDDELEVFRLNLDDLGYEVTDILDRTYFQSIYFREPGGVLCELATDPPGFAVDEAPDALGRRLCLPPWLESHRAAIEGALPPIAT